MSKLYDLVEIKKDSFFNGAVQAEWFYDQAKRKNVSESYIFHGPKYYGVSSSDIDTKSHKLCDTVTFAKTIYNKIYKDSNSSRFALTIAGYGAGKSHLSLALSTLLSGDDIKTSNNILENIKNADQDGYEYIKQYENDKHLVLVLNGINDFNLNKEVLRVAKQSLSLHGVTEDIFNDMTIAYNTAGTFLQNTYKDLYAEYMNVAKEVTKYKYYSEKELKDVLLKNIQDYEAFTIVNTVYKKITGNDINITEGISAGIVLERLHKKYVVEDKKFKSIVIIFDEFGRYLEFASTQPGLAGEAAIQQIFESVQNATPNMLFIGFIQSDLNAYMNRVNNDNITRYVSRYQVSDKYYLSSNLETVLSSLVKKKENSETIISNIFDGALSYFATSSQRNIIRWLPELANKNVWKSEMMYKQTILKGCFPIHPLTLSTLATLSSFMQQRSTFTFLSDIFEGYMNLEVGERIPLIHPTALIDSPMFTELINAEERQRVPGQNCIQYSDILEANEEVLTKADTKILSSILIMNICKFKIYDKTDLNTAIEAVSGISGDLLANTISKLENKLGLIYFDNAINRYNFMTEGNSKVDYNKLFMRKKIIVSTRDIISSLPEEIRKDLKLGVNELTNFGRLNNVTSNEWAFTKDIIDIEDLTGDMLKSLKEQIAKEIHPEATKGKLIYLYCNSNTYQRVDIIAKYLRELDYDNVPILFGILLDTNDQIKDSIINIRTANSFSLAERESFSKYLRQTLKEENQKIIRVFMESAQKKQYISPEGLIVAAGVSKVEMDKKFEKIFTKIVPFTIDGFEKKITSKARGYYNSIVDSILQGKLEDVVEYNNLPIDVRNRINSILSVKSLKGWKVLYENNVLAKPLNPVVNEIYTEIENRINKNEKITFSSIIQKYTKAPYGLNIYSISLLIIYTVAMNKENLNVYKGIAKSRVLDILSCFNDDKKEQFTEFAKYSIEYSEESEKDKVLALIEKVEKNRSVAIDEVEPLYQVLKKINDLDVPNELRGRYCSCESTLKIAIDKNIEINSDIEEAKRLYKVLDKNPFSVRNILNKCNNIREGVINGSTYRYSNSQVELAKNIKEDSLDSFRNRIIPFAEKCSLENDNNTCNIYKNTIRQFRECEYFDIVTLLEKSLAIFQGRVEKNKIIKEFIKKAHDKIKELKMNIDMTINLEQCKSQIISLMTESANLNTSGNSELVKVDHDLEKLKGQIDLIEKNTLTLLEDVERIICETDSLAKLNACVNKIERIMANPMLEGTKNKISELRAYIVDIEKHLQEFKYRRFLATEVDKAINSLNVKYSRYEKIQLLIDNVKYDLYEQLKVKDNTWKNEFIDKNSDLSKYNVSQLKEIVRKASVDKEYLSDENKVFLTELTEKVDSMLSLYKIENIANIFEELSGEDKAKCIELLKGKC